MIFQHGYYIQLCLQLCNTPLVPACLGDKSGQAGTSRDNWGHGRDKPGQLICYYLKKNILRHFK